MARPNHDIPNLLLGGVRDYAEAHDISPEEAHIRLLRLSLKEVGILGCTENAPVADPMDESDDSDT